MIRHVLLVLEKNLEKVASENGQVLLFEELRVDLGKGIEARVHLILWNGALVTDEALQFTDLVVVFCLEAVDVLLRDLHVRLQLKDIDKELTLVCELLLVVVDKLNRTRVRQFR